MEGSARRNWIAVVSALAAPAAVAAILVPLRSDFHPVDAALVLMAVVVAIAASGFRIAALLAALSSAFWFDFFLIPPYHSFTGTNGQDFETIVLLIAVGVAVAELAIRGRRQRLRAGAARRHLELLYEASVTIGTTLDMRQTARELVQVAVPEFADFVTVDLNEAVLRGDEPASGADTELRRVASGGIGPDSPLRPVGTPVTLVPDVTEENRLFGGPRTQIVSDLRTSVAWRLQSPEPARPVLAHGIRSMITAPLRTHGALIGVAGFWRSEQAGQYSDDDLAAATELALKAAIAIDNGRRYTRERATALTLQRSLLPQQLNGRSAVEVASRYLPADSQAGIGGDWYDLIPLSGTRVALVIGDITGHGLHASAAMGQLRTAVRTLADVDLPPAELLTHLDDLVIHLASDERADVGQDGQPAPGEFGATCLYAVYDPISCHCTLATAGHPLPIVCTPGRAEQVASDRIGPPLGVGGMPFETIDLDLTGGSVLALFTDGLIESRHRDMTQGLAELCRVLAQPATSLEEAGDAVIDATRADHPADDVALMLIRTRALPADRVATWNIPAEPAMVAHARRLATDQLRAWGLSAAEFTTELVVSELVTNAIRHGAPPIQLRLIRDDGIVCEVADASSTAPHLQRSRALDEGGRGLLLVCELAESWGTRQTTTGKTIWCQQVLPAD
ncbi:MAG TPA: SpoIIE family protein phosphatase [Streptosporangiaceae bacterium]|jgi:serine phosphatase RsbU (regulator of sigma subunit)/anti-sigma regulatory factor (Ser/Thr protein kinase)